jgi:hypothetical protein
MGKVLGVVLLVVALGDEGLKVRLIVYVYPIRNDKTR